MKSYSAGPILVAQSQSPIARGRAAPVAQTQVEIMRDGKRREVVSFLKGAQVWPGGTGEEPAPAANPPSSSDRGFSDEGNSGGEAESSPGDPAGRSAGLKEEILANPRGVDVR